MRAPMEAELGLPTPVKTALNGFITAAQAAFGDNLCAVVLYGSAAEGRLRATSDVNLLLVLKLFEQAQADAVREPFRVAHAAVQLEVMFLLESEIAGAAEAFAVKFSDILARHRVLHGSDPFASLVISRPAAIRRLQQVLVNLALRLRERYVLVSLREEQLARVIADVAGPLRASAATLLKLEGKGDLAPKAALQAVVRDAALANAEPLLAHISEAREQGLLPPGVAPALLFDIMRVTGALQARAAKLS